MRQISSAVLIAAVCGCGNESRLTRPLEAPVRAKAAAHYEVVKRSSSLGGTASRGTAISNRGWVAGWSNLPGDAGRHATSWRDGSILDLGTLGGPGSTVPWPGQNNGGMIVGISQTAEPDPLHEDWSCEAGGFLPETTDLICRGFVWENGVMRELPTLGGNHGFATGVNNRGQVVGWAETPVHDPTCLEPQVLQFRAVMWEPRRGTKQELPPIAGNSTSAATAINEKGQVVGISGDCDQAVGRFSALHAVLWENGTATEIPNLGGVTWHTPMDINDSGDVIGFSNPPGPGDPEGEFISHAFLWVHGSETAEDLGTVGGDPLSEAFAINSRGQIVGISFGGPDGPRGFIWQDGVMTDLNELVDSPDRILSAQDINDAGEITGRVLDQATGETLAFVATPVPAGPDVDPPAAHSTSR